MVGDIFFCLMPNHPEDFIKIEPSHRVRPYLILKKNEDTFLALQSSSKALKGGIAHHTLGQIQIDDSYFSLEKIYELPVNNIKNYFKSCNSETMEEIYRRLSIRNLCNFESLLGIEKVKPEVKIGDIFKRDNSLYYIQELDVGYATCYAIQPYNKNSNLARVKILDYVYLINLNNNFIFKNVDIYELFMFTDTYTQKYIDRLINKKHASNIHAITNFKVGDVILFNDLRYVVGDEADKKQHKIYKTITSREKGPNYIYKLKGNGATYRIDLSKAVVAKLDADSVVVDHVNLESVISLRAKRKEKLSEAEEQSKAKKLSKYSFITEPGTIVKDDLESNFYVYLFDKGDTSFIVDVDDFYNGEYEVEPINCLSSFFEITDNILDKEDFNVMLNELIDIKHKDRYILQEIVASQENIDRLIFKSI